MLGHRALKQISMSPDDFPQYSKTQQTGNAGVTIVEQLVEHELGWHFRRNNQQDDFGIDGYLDVIREDGAVLGRSVAVQIKTGKSHVIKSSNFGFVLKGTRKHLNYFLNYPIPVLLVLVDEVQQRAWWVHICPQAIRLRKTDWEITVPQTQRLDASCVTDLNGLAGKTMDYLPIVQQMTKVREAACEAAAIVFLITKNEIVNGETTRLKAFFAMFEASPDNLPDIRNKVSLAVHGYAQDDRELYEITEVRTWFAAAENAICGWPYYWNLTLESGTVVLFFYCTSEVEVGEYSPDRLKKRVEFPILEINRFMTRHFASLNTLTAKHGISEIVNEEICRAVGGILFRIAGIDPPP